MGKYYMKKRNPEEIELIKNWPNFASENLLSAKVLMNEDFSPFHTICFMCQGSSEKYLKAYLIWNGWELEKIDDLEELLNYAFKLDAEGPFGTAYFHKQILHRFRRESSSWLCCWRKHCPSNLRINSTYFCWI